MRISRYGPRTGRVALTAALLLSTFTSIAPSGRAAPVSGPVALIDLRTDTYLGLAGGLYPGGSNVIPSDHISTGMERSRAIRPLDALGNPDPNGAYVLLSVGMSNTSAEFGRATLPPTFAHKAATDPTVNHSRLVIVNGAFGGQTATRWESPAAPVYDAVRDQRLTPSGVTERQVQVVWLKQANPNPRDRLPSPTADAFAMERSLGNIIRALRVRYPNLQQVFLSSRVYGGYSSGLNPEPFAYEYGFSVKWLIQAQIAQMRNRGRIMDPLAGDLDTRTTPWLAWGPYLWANGTTPRSDGLLWHRTDFIDDGTHPSYAGIDKVASALLRFFKNHPATVGWFLASPLPNATPTPTPTPTTTATPTPAPSSTVSPSPSPSPNSSDTSRPVVSITSPTEGTTVSGVVTVTVSAVDDVGVIRVEFVVDGVRVGVDLGSPYVFTWTTTSLGNGIHTIQAAAIDEARNQAAQRIQVSVQNPP